MIRKTVLPLYSNTAACYVHLQEFPEALEAANEALSIDPLNVKCLYRRAKVRMDNLASG